MIIEDVSSLLKTFFSVLPFYMLVFTFVWIETLFLLISYFTFILSKKIWKNTIRIISRSISQIEKVCFSRIIWRILWRPRNKWQRGFSRVLYVYDQNFKMVEEKRRHSGDTKVIRNPHKNSTYTRQCLNKTHELKDSEKIMTGEIEKDKEKKVCKMEQRRVPQYFVMTNNQITRKQLQQKIKAFNSPL